MNCPYCQRPMVSLTVLVRAEPAYLCLTGPPPCGATYMHPVEPKK